MDMLGFVVQKLFAMQCQMHVWKSSGYSQQRNIFVKQDVKLTEPPDAEPHVRWCERSAAKAASYSIFLETAGDLSGENHHCYSADRIVCKYDRAVNTGKYKIPDLALLCWIGDFLA